MERWMVSPIPFTWGGFPESPGIDGCFSAKSKFLSTPRQETPVSKKLILVSIVVVKDWLSGWLVGQVISNYQIILNNLYRDTDWVAVLYFSLFVSFDLGLSKASLLKHRQPLRAKRFIDLPRGYYTSCPTAWKNKPDNWQWWKGLLCSLRRKIGPRAIIWVWKTLSNSASMWKPCFCSCQALVVCTEVICI